MRRICFICRDLCLGFAHLVMFYSSCRWVRLCGIAPVGGFAGGTNQWGTDIDGGCEKVTDGLDWFKEGAGGKWVRGAATCCGVIDVGGEWIGREKGVYYRRSCICFPHFQPPAALLGRLGHLDASPPLWGSAQR